MGVGEAVLLISRQFNVHINLALNTWAKGLRFNCLLRLLSVYVVYLRPQKIKFSKYLNNVKQIDKGESRILEVDGYFPGRYNFYSKVGTPVLPVEHHHRGNSLFTRNMFGG